MIFSVSYSTVAQRLKAFDKIFVSGPQRSGTTIAGRIIAADAGKRYFDESDISIRNRDKLARIIKKEKCFVVQCPGISRFVHHYGDRDDTAIVFMVRSISEIIKSQDAIEWDGEEIEKRYYEKTDGPIAKIKYDFWDNHQRSKIKNRFEIAYESLSMHPLWIPKNKRKKFSAKQWCQ